MVQLLVRLSLATAAAAVPPPPPGCGESHSVQQPQDCASRQQTAVRQPVAPALKSDDHATSTVAAQDNVVTVDPSGAGLRFDGHGALSAGASSRLIFDYAEPARSEILDYLYKPKFGANLHICKVEIGGDTQSSDGTEPSHMHTRDDLNCTHEFWMMSEAKKRNPGVITYGLPWGAPGWINNQSGYYHGPDMITYLVNWLKCARDYHGIMVDYVGLWNERAWGTVEFVKGLKQTIVTAGLKTQLILGDSASMPPVLKYTNDTVFMDSFVGVGLHYPCTASGRPGGRGSEQGDGPGLLGAGKAIWASEDLWTEAEWPGATCWAKLLNQNFIRANLTSTIAWATVWSVYPRADNYGGIHDTLSGDGYWGPGLMYAWQPHSGHYVVPPTVWSSAHTTQFTEPGWKILHGGSGDLAHGGSYLTMVSPDRDHFSTIIETGHAHCDRCPANNDPKTASTTAQSVIINLLGGLARAKVVHAWHTDNATKTFSNIGSMPVKGGVVTLTAEPESIYTITTTTGQSRGSFRTPPAASSPFPSNWADDFDSGVVESLPKYWSDQCGSFQVMPSTGRSGNSVVQRVSLRPGVNKWTNNLQNPLSILGDPTASSATQLSIDVRVPSDAVLEPPEPGGKPPLPLTFPAFWIGLCGRIGVVDHLQAAGGAKNGVCLQLEATTVSGPGVSWRVEQDGAQVIAGLSGTLSNASLSDWHTLELHFGCDGATNESVSAVINGTLVGTGTVWANNSAGMVGIATGWHLGEFDRFKLAGCSHKSDDSMVRTSSVSSSVSFGNKLLGASDIGILNVTQPPFNVDNTGKTDVTQVLQHAIDYAINASLAVFLPYGNYLVSGTLVCRSHDSWDHVFGARGHESRWRPHVLLGDARLRPNITLAPNSSGFDRPKSPKYVVHFYTTNFGGNEQDNINFNQLFKGINVVISEGNPGAVGIRHRAAQGSSIQDVTIFAGSGFAGISGGMGSGGSPVGVTVVGGEYGAFMEACQPGPVITGMTFLHQKSAAIVYNGISQTLTAVGIHIEMAAHSTTAVLANESNNAGGQISFVDSVIDFPLQADQQSCAAFRSAHSVYLNNNWVRNCRTLVAFDGARPNIVHNGTANVEDWTHVRELAVGIGYLKNASTCHPVHSPVFLNGSRTTNDLIDIVRGDAVPSPQIQSQHLWTETDFPTFQTKGACNVKAAPYNAAGDATTDDTASLQRALDECLVTFLPKGAYLISRPLVVRSNTSLIGVARHLSRLLPSKEGLGTDSQPLPLIQTEKGQGQIVIAFLMVVTWEHLINTYGVLWQSNDETSIFRQNYIYRWGYCYYGFPHPKAVPSTTPTVPCLPAQGIVHALNVVTGSGRFYNYENEDSQYEDKLYEGHMLVIGNTRADTIRFYMANFEHSHATMRIRGSYNVHIYGFKCEAPTGVYVYGSDNVNVFGNGGDGAGGAETKPLYLAEDTDHFRFCNIISASSNSGWTAATEVRNGSVVVASRSCDRPVLFMRGPSGPYQSMAVSSTAQVGEPPFALRADERPTGAQVVSNSNVVWTDPVWANDGSGAMPIGNGDITSSVWVESSTGDLRLLISKSDVFDENSQPVKVGVLRVQFDPPLWRPDFSTATKQSNTNGSFCQTLHLVNSTVTIKSPMVFVSVFVDLNAALRNGARHRGAGFLHVTATGRRFSMKVTLEPYRKAGARTKLGRTRSLCYARYEQADTIIHGAKDYLVPSADAITWHHWNHINTSYFSQTMADQGLNSSVGSTSAPLIDPFTRRAWGGSVAAPALLHRPVSDTESLSLQGGNLSTIDVTVTLLTLEPAEAPTADAWPAALAQVRPAPPAQATPPLTCPKKEGDQSNCATTWEEIIERSYIQVTAAKAANASATTSAADITDHANWDRYLSLIQGRVAFAPVKFNGQAFTCNNTGHGWDFRGCGAAYWWQNTRQPYYNVLAQGDYDSMRAFLAFYRRMLPYVQARTAAQFKGTSTELKPPAALYPETTTQFGTYTSGDWGCKSEVPRKYGASDNGNVRFHWTGSLELSLMVLDQYDATGNLDDLRINLPIAVGVAKAYQQRFPNKDRRGKTDMFPAQALEGYECGDPSGKSRGNCPSNPSTDIGGLMSLLPKLIALPSSVTTSSQVATWKQQLLDLPPLPQGPAANRTYNQQKIYPIATGNGFPTSGAENSSHPERENPELYVAHPFRLYGVGKPTDITLVQQAYAERHAPCNEGWCSDIIQAAMLNMTDDAANQLAARAAAGPAAGFRFRGFAKHYQDYEPSSDHFGFMRTGLNYMLMAPLDDVARSMLLFPTWPTDRWNVRFKMHAPRNTTVEASCQDGKLEYLIVTPPERKADITVLNCEH